MTEQLKGVQPPISGHVTDADLLRICQTFNPGQDLDLAKAVRDEVLSRQRAAASHPEAVERLARDMAIASDWKGWDTATTPAHTPNGNEPDEERDYWRDMARIALASLPLPNVCAPGPNLPVELSGVPLILAKGKGAWRSCNGCHELNEGRDTGPFSYALKCHLGQGCCECGGIGAVWDDTDYQALADAMAGGSAAGQGEGAES